MLIFWAILSAFVLLGHTEPPIHICQFKTIYAVDFPYFFARARSVGSSNNSVPKAVVPLVTDPCLLYGLSPDPKGEKA